MYYAQYLRRDLDSWYTFHDVFCRHYSFGLAYVLLPATIVSQKIIGGIFCSEVYLNKNCLFRLLMSIVSMSMTCISLNPDKARLARISQPRPPAPITRILHLFRRKSYTYTSYSRALRTTRISKKLARTASPGENDSSVRGPGLSST